MQRPIATYVEALSLFKEFNQDESLLKHAYSVEGVMRYMARKAGEDEEKWGIIGLVHDLDYERFPKQHCTKVKEILEKTEADVIVEGTIPEMNVNAILK